MTSISPSLILTLCILAALVMTVLAFTVWRLMRARPDTDAEVSALTASANPFREPSREQAEYMRGQRRRYVGVMMGELERELEARRWGVVVAGGANTVEDVAGGSRGGGKGTSGLARMAMANARGLQVRLIIFLSPNGAVAICRCWV